MSYLLSQKTDHTFDIDHTIDIDHNIDIGDYTIDGSLELSFGHTFMEKNFEINELIKDLIAKYH